MMYPLWYNMEELNFEIVYSNCTKRAVHECPKTLELFMLLVAFRCTFELYGPTQNAQMNQLDVQ